MQRISKAANIMRHTTCFAVRSTLADLRAHAAPTVPSLSTSTQDDQAEQVENDFCAFSLLAGMTEFSPISSAGGWLLCTSSDCDCLFDSEEPCYRSLLDKYVADTKRLIELPIEKALQHSRVGSVGDYVGIRKGTRVIFGQICRLGFGVYSDYFRVRYLDRDKEQWEQIEDCHVISFEDFAS